MNSNLTKQTSQKISTKIHPERLVNWINEWRMDKWVNKWMQKLQFSYWSAILLHWTTYFLPETLEELYMDSGHWAGRKQCKCFPSATICAACQGLYWPHLLSMICAQRVYAKDHQTRDHRVHSLTMRAHSYILVEWASLFTCEWTLCCIPWGVSLIQ